MQYYWKLDYGDYKDLKTIYIPPESVDTIKRRWDRGDPIHLNTGSIPANQIRSFEISDRNFAQTPLLEEVAQTFKEPIVKDGAIAARWVKKDVSQDKWNRYYSAIPSYKNLEDSGGMVTIAFRVAVHDIDVNKVQYCSDDEIKKLIGSN